MAERTALLLSVDFEDWHQLVRRRLGAADWQKPGPALARQTDALLQLFDELNAKATFFILGMAARAHPQLIARIAERGHEIGCHGDAHVPVHSQTPEAFDADLRAARRTIEELSGERPVGYRAPAFSITSNSTWAYDVLAENGFRFDASQHDSPRIRNRVDAEREGPHALDNSLWEFPVAVWRAGEFKLPVGGASYWAMLPRAAILHGLRHAGQYAGLYLHPQELDPEPLRIGLKHAQPHQLAHAKLRELQRNAARRRAPATLRAIAAEHQLIPYREAYATLSDGARASS